MPQLYTATTTAQQIVNGVSQDVRQTLGSSGSDANILLDYVNRTSLDLLRASRWLFLLSSPLRFITEEGQSNYFLASGAAPAGTVNTNLALTDLRTIIKGSVRDRSNFRSLGYTALPPNLAKMSFPDATMRPGRPAMWSLDTNNPNVMQIFPAPDNQNTYQPIPNSPQMTDVAGGSSPVARTLSARLTYVDENGNESAASINNLQVVEVNKLLVVTSPFPLSISGETSTASSEGGDITSYNVYVSLNSGSETKQNISPIAIGTNWTEPGGGITTNGVSFPTTNNLTAMQGYVIEFRYQKQRTQVTTLGQVLQIPDDYKDIVIEGVNARAFRYLTRFQEAAICQQQYKEGITQIIRDTNLFFRGGADFIVPDAQSIGGVLPAVETLDLSFLTP